MSIPRHARLPTDFRQDVRIHARAPTESENGIERPTGDNHGRDKTGDAKGNSEAPPISLICGRSEVFCPAISLICGTETGIHRIWPLEFQRSCPAYRVTCATDKRDSDIKSPKSATPRRDTRQNTRYAAICDAEPAPLRPHRGDGSGFNATTRYRLITPYHYVDSITAKTTANHAKRQTRIARGRASI